jgi:hypothetical protein
VVVFAWKYDSCGRDGLSEDSRGYDRRRLLADACRGAVGDRGERRVLVAGADSGLCELETSKPGLGCWIGTARVTSVGGALDVAAADHLKAAGAERVDGDLSTFLALSAATRARGLLQHAGTYEAVRAQMLDALRRGKGDGPFSTTGRYRVIELRRR